MTRAIANNWEIRHYEKPDPITGKSGVMYEFESDVDHDESRQVWFTLNGNWPTGSVNVWIKAGSINIRYFTAGPDRVGFVVPEVWGPIAALGSGLAAFVILYKITRKRTSIQHPPNS